MRFRLGAAAEGPAHYPTGYESVILRRSELRSLHIALRAEPRPG
jgi:hypothetical protein